MNGTEHSPDTRLGRTPLLLSAAVLAGLLCILSAVYGRWLPWMFDQYDVWFRTDVNHYVNWVHHPTQAYRAFLHPATLLVIKPYSLVVGQFLPIPGTPLPLFALPVILVNAGVTTTAAALLPGPASPYRVVVNLVLLTAIGPLLLLAPIPESHTLGGVSLLIETAFVLRFATADAACDDRRRQTARRILAWAAAATGFSLSNIVPATVIALPVLGALPVKVKRRCFLGALIAGGLLATLLVAHLYIRYGRGDAPGGFTAFVATRAALWLKPPDALSLARSVRALVVAHFGIPPTDTAQYVTDAGVVYDGVILRDATAPLQVAAAILWWAGVAAWFRMRRRRAEAAGERLLILCCVGAAAALVAFHATFASDEAFMFSPHAWPFVVVPGIVALWDSAARHERLPAILLGTCLVLCGIQSARGVARLTSLRPTPPAFRAH